MRKGLTKSAWLSSQLWLSYFSLPESWDSRCSPPCLVPSSPLPSHTLQCSTLDRAWRITTELSCAGFPRRLSAPQQDYAFWFSLHKTSSTQSEETRPLHMFGPVSVRSLWALTHTASAPASTQSSLVMLIITLAPNHCL